MEKRSFSELFDQLSREYPLKTLKFPEEADLPPPREMEALESGGQTPPLEPILDTKYTADTQASSSNLSNAKPEAIEQIATLVLTSCYPPETLMKISDNAAKLDKLVIKYYGEWRQMLKDRGQMSKEEKAKSFVKITFQLMDEARPMITDPMATLFLFKYLDAVTKSVP
jgi:hypothetical protein